MRPTCGNTWDARNPSKATGRRVSAPSRARAPDNCTGVSRTAEPATQYLRHTLKRHVSHHCYTLAQFLRPSGPAACTGLMYSLFSTPPSQRAGVPTDTPLQRTLREHQILLDSTGVGIVFLRQRSVVRCNQRYAEIFGYASPPGGAQYRSLLPGPRCLSRPRAHCLSCAGPGAVLPD